MKAAVAAAEPALSMSNGSAAKPVAAVADCGSLLGTWAGSLYVLNSVKERGYHGALRHPGKWTNGVNGSSDIEHVAIEGMELLGKAT